MTHWGERLSDRFERLSPMQKLRASELLGRYLHKWKHVMTPRLLGVLVGRARYFSSKTPEELSAWGLHMWHVAGGKARMRQGSPSLILKGQGDIVWWARRRKAAAQRKKKQDAELGLDRENRVGQADLTGL